MRISGRIWPLAALVGGAAASLVYGRFIEPHWLQVRRAGIHLRRLPTPLEGLTIGLLTDLHAGPLTPPSLIRRAVDAVLAEDPDLIAITGDVSDDHARGFAPVFAELGRLRARLGVYTVPGNHDHRLGLAEWQVAVAGCPRIEDLTNRAVLLNVRGARLCVAGVDDYALGKPELNLPAPGERDTTILLAHSPDQAEQSRRGHDAVDLVIGGHTHGGQVRFPLIGAPKNSSNHPELYEAGLRRRPWTQVYTSRGVGMVGLPVRFLARPEVSMLRLTGTPRPRQSAGSRLALSIR
jgi:uncharacterized protein